MGPYRSQSEPPHVGTDAPQKHCNSRVTSNPTHYRRAYIQYGGNAIKVEKAKMNVPTDVGHASKFVSGMDVKDVLHRQRRAEKIAAVGMDNTLGLASGAGSLI